MEQTATGNLFFEHPILNSPYEYPDRKGNLVLGSWASSHH